MHGWEDLVYLRKQGPDGLLKYLSYARVTSTGVKRITVNSDAGSLPQSFPGAYSSMQANGATYQDHIDHRSGVLQP